MKARKTTLTTLCLAGMLGLSGATLAGEKMMEGKSMDKEGAMAQQGQMNDTMDKETLPGKTMMEEEMGGDGMAKEGMMKEGTMAGETMDKKM